MVWQSQIQGFKKSRNTVPYNCLCVKSKENGKDNDRKVAELSISKIVCGAVQVIKEIHDNFGKEPVFQVP